MRPLAIDAVLFDFDGVLMKSIEDHYRSWNEAFRPHNVEIGWEEFCVLEGQNLFTIARQLCANHDLPESLGDAIGRQKNMIYLRSAKIVLYPGVHEIMEYLHQKNKKRGVVTGALKDRFHKTVDDKFTSMFDVIVTADDVTHTKPHPEPYLKAMDALNLEPAQCLVIENAPLGVTSAKAAGMPCLAIMTTLTSAHLKDADWVLHDLPETINWMHTHVA